MEKIFKLTKKIFISPIESWKTYGFEIVVITSLVFILFTGFIYWIKGKKGSWTPFNTKFNINDNKINKFPLRESKGEIECKRVLEKIFKKSFPKDRPNFLRNPVTGGNFNLELDCYNKDLKLAVEYSGKQHYVYTPYFHKNKESFTNQKYRDYMKKTMCKDNGIILIEVPYTVEIKDIESFILKELRNNNFSF